MIIDNLKKSKSVKKPLKQSSKLWMQRHINDRFVIKSKKEGYASRACYKLLEIQSKFKILKSGHKIVELGAAPGGWTRVIVDCIGEKGNVLAIDLLDLKFKHPNIEFIQMDFLQDFEPLIESLSKIQVDGVLSDLAPDFTGDRRTDHLRIMNMAESCLDFADCLLKPGGYFVAKILPGEDEPQLLLKLKKLFKKVSYYKPKSSRKESAEIYIVCLKRLELAPN